MKRIAVVIAAGLLCCSLCACKPAVVILSPVDNAILEAGSEVVFVCLAVDIPHGMLGGSAIVWRSDRDGMLGTGARLRRTGLSPGRHTITAEATDAQNWHNAASCAVFVNDAAGPAGTTTIAEAAPPPETTTTIMVSTTTSTAPPVTTSTAVLSTTSSVPITSSTTSTTTTTISPWSLVHLGDDVRIAALWGSAEDNIYAAGGDIKTNTALVFHFDGALWSEALRVPDTCSFSGLWGSSGRNVYAAGGYSEGMLQKAVIYRFDGVDWSEEYASTMGTLFSIRGDAAWNSIYAVGATATGPLVLQSGGSRWQTRYAGLLPGAFFDIRDISDKLFAAAGTYLMPDDPEAPPQLAGKVFQSSDRGFSWTPVHEIPGVFLQALWCSGDTVAAVGGDPAERSRGIAIRSTDQGRTWESPAIEAAHYCLNDISGTAGDELYIAADGPDGALFHYDGAAWSRVTPEHDALPPLRAVWSIDSRNIVAAGDGVIVHYRP